jgi:hypothetical protein
VSDLETISSLATAGGTLVLAIATFSSVRSANRAARAAERSLLAGLRPVLMPSRLQDPPEKVSFVDGHWVRVEGGHAVIEVTDDAIYMAAALRNAGSGLAVLDGWTFQAHRARGDEAHADPADFRRLSRDIYVPGGDLGFWQGAFRDPSDPCFAEVKRAVDEGRTMTVDLLYGDHEGGQRTISRFTLAPVQNGAWLATVGRHWNLDRSDPRRSENSAVAPRRPDPGRLPRGATAPPAD